MCIKTVMISVKFEVCSIVGKNKHTAEILLDDSCKTINSTDFPLPTISCRTTLFSQIKLFHTNITKIFFNAEEKYIVTRGLTNHFIIKITEC